MQKNTDQSVGIYICIYRPTVYLQKTTTGITGLKIDIFVDHGGCTYLTVSCYLYIYIYIFPMVAGKRLRMQMEKRSETARWVVRNIAKEICKDERRILSTNRLLPQGTLRRRCIKQIFGGWTNKAQGRCFTKKLASMVCSKLRKKFGLELEGPDLESDRLLTLLKLARKHRLKKPSKMSEMDNVETLPFFPQDRFAKQP